MTIYSPQQVQNVMQQLYSDNSQKRLKAMKIAKHLSELAAPVTIRADMLTDLYSSNFDVFYSFSYTRTDIFNPWLKSMCKNHPIDGKTTGRIDDQHFVFEDEFNGESIRIEVFGRYEEPQ